MKEIIFWGDSLEVLRSFDTRVKNNIGYQLHRIQNNLVPNDFKIMKSIGAGVREIRVKDKSGIYRTIYTTKIGELVYVLHAFKKKTEKTSQIDLDKAKRRLKQIISENNK